MWTVSMKKGMFRLMMGTAISQLLLLVFSPILTRLYTPEAYGEFTFFLAIVSVVGVMSTARYEQAILLPEEENETVVLVWLSFVFVTVVSFFFGLILWIVDKTFHMMLSINFIAFIGGISVFLLGTYNILSTVSNRFKAYGTIAKTMWLKTLILIIFQIVLAYIVGGSNGLIIGYVVSSAIAVFYLYLQVKRFVVFKSINITKMYQVAKKYGDFPKFQLPHAMVNTLSSHMPVYIFSIFSSATIVGLYALSTRIVLSPLTIVSGAVNRVFSQRASQLKNNKKELYKLTLHTVKTIFLVTFFPFSVIVVIAPDLFAWGFGEEWREAGIYTQILAPWIYMILLVSPISYLASIYGKQKKAMIIELCYMLIRLTALVLGLWLGNIYTALILFSLSGFFVLLYSFFWQISLTKPVGYM
jgi:O-antigen/teichoic acid export membrane protein